MYMLAFISVLSGFLISFLGGLPLGNLNVTAVRITLADGVGKAYQFSLGVVLTEMLYMFFCLQGVAQAHQYAAVFSALRWLMVVLLFIMATACFMTFLKKERQEQGDHGQKNKRKTKIAAGFALGLGLSAINVLQIPYWTGWIAIAMQNSWVGKDYTAYLFILAAGGGTLTCLAIFIAAGKKLSAWLTRNKRLLDLVFGVIFLTVALAQLYLIVKSLKG
jgi:threonine/homoserine/homoserine lactone efflux protein